MVKRKVALTFADTSSHGNDEENKTMTRRSRRVGHANTTKSSHTIDSDSDDGIDFVDEVPVAAGSVAAAAASISVQRNQRQQQRDDSKNQNQRRAVQRDENTLRQQEEDDIMHAIELSKLEMEAEKKRSDSQEDWLTCDDEFPLEPQQRFGDSQASQLSRKSFSSRGSAEDGASNLQSVNVDQPDSQTSSTTCEDVEEPTFLEMAQSSQGRFNEWQDTMGSTDWEDPSLQTGEANSDRGTPNLFPSGEMSTEKREKRENSQDDHGRHQDDVDILTIEKSPPESRRCRLRLRKRPAEDEEPNQPSKLRKVPAPPHVVSLDQLDDNEEDEEVEKIDVMNDEGEITAEDNSEENVDSGEMNKNLEVFKLVDTRKPCHPKQPYYAPQNSSKNSYTKVIYQLIQAYCFRLRRAQAKVLTIVGWVHPVVTGNCFHDTLVLRKRGTRSFTLYTLSDSEEDEMMVTGDQGKLSVSRKLEASPKTRIQKRKNKVIFDEDADSDFENFIPVGRRKTSMQGRQNLSAPDVVEMLKKDGRFSQEEGEKERTAVKEFKDSEILSQTLVQDQTETQDFGMAQKEATEIPEYDSDTSQPIQRTVLQSDQDDAPNDSVLSHHAGRSGSQGSVSDIFKVSTDDETDVDLEVGDYSGHQTSGSPSKDTEANSEVRRPASQDSFDEELLSLNIPKTSHCDKNIESPSAENHSQTRRVKTGGGSLRNCDETQSEENGTPEMSFEENRYQFYNTTSASPRSEGIWEMEKGGCTSSQEDFLQDDESDEKEDIDDHQNKDTSSPEGLNVKQRREKQTKESDIQDDTCKRQSSVSKEKQSLNTNQSALKLQAKATRFLDSTHLKEGNHEDLSCDEAVEDETEWEHSKGEQMGDIDDEEDDDDQEDDEEEVEEEEKGRDEEVDDDDDNGDNSTDRRRHKEETEIRKRGHRENTEDDEDDIHSEHGRAEDQQEDGTTEDEQDGEEELVSEPDQVAWRTEDKDEVGPVNTVKDDAVNEDTVEDTPNSVIGVQCPLCGVQYSIDLIEAHASGCNGPTLPPPPPPPDEDGNSDLTDPHEQLFDERGPQSGRHRDAQAESPNQANHFEDSAGTSTAQDRKRRNKIKDDQREAKPMRGIATKIIHENTSNKDVIPKRMPVDQKRPAETSDEDNSESFSESTDHLNATLFQLVEDNNLKLCERKRKRAPDRPAKRQRLAEGDKREQTASNTETTEPCFICNKRIPKSLYAQHVQEEIDRAEVKMHSDDAVVQPRRGLRSKAAASRATVGESSREADNNTDQTDTSHGVGLVIEDSTSCDREQDSDSESDDSSTEDQLFNPRVSESPIKAFRPISKQPMNLIDFKNQFQSNVKGSSKQRKSGSSSSKGRHGRGSKGGGKKRWGKKRGRYSRK